MTDDRLRGWLGNAHRDPGCEAGFRVLDQYVDALLRGEDVRTGFPDVIAHLENCAACREDTEGLIAALRDDPER